MTEHHIETGAQERARFVKINFQLGPEDQAQGVDAENLWAEPMGDDHFRIRNIPFYVYGVSYKDVVYATEVDGRRRFKEIVSHNGHSTYRVLVNDQAGYESDRFQALWRRLSELGCSYEVAKCRWITIDVPPESDVFAVYGILEQGNDEGVWSFEEAHCGNPKVKLR
jgi:hypothetical protein